MSKAKQPKSATRPTAESPNKQLEVERETVRQVRVKTHVRTGAADGGCSACSQGDSRL